MRKAIKRLILVLITLVFIWTGLTFWAESEGPLKQNESGNSAKGFRALIVYDPDPFYNLDEQVCESFGRGLAESGWRVTIATVAAAKEVKEFSFDLYVLCANTYNWSPDWAVSRFIKKHPLLNGKNVVAITLGAGSTGRSQRVLERMIKDKQAILLDSRTFWLWRPNDKSRLKESNVQVAVSMAKTWGRETVRRLNHKPERSDNFSPEKSERSNYFFPHFNYFEILPGV